MRKASATKEEGHQGCARHQPATDLSWRSNLRPVIVRRLALSEEHKPTGRTKHYHMDSLSELDEYIYKGVRNEARLIAPPHTLVIVQYGETEFNLIHFDDKGQWLTDTLHE